MANEKILTIDIGASKVRIQTVHKNGEFDMENFTPLVGVELDNNILMELLVEKINSYLNGKKNISAISIGVPGYIEEGSVYGGIIRNMPNIKNVGELQIEKALRDKFKSAVFVLNDADAGGLGEWWLGSGKGFKNLIYLTLSTGVGSGLILNNQLQANSELGHTPLIIEGEKQLCSCGQTNHAESFLGTEGLARIYALVFGIDQARLNAEDKYFLSPKMRIGVEQNDKRWLAVQEKYVNYLVLFLHSLAITYHPEVIILGGGVAYGNNILLEKIKEKFEDKTIIESANFENSVNIGLAKYAFDIKK